MTEDTQNQKEESFLVDTLKSTFVGLLGAIGIIWCFVALGALFGLAPFGGEEPAIGWEWYHWIVLAPVWGFMLFTVWLMIWGLGEWIRGRK